MTDCRKHFPDENSLVEACLDGSERAWECFQERYGGFIYSIASMPQWGFGRQDVEDLCEEIYVKLIESALSRFNYSASLKTYIGTIAKRACIDRVRSLRERSSRATLSMEQDEFMGRTLDQVVESSADVAARVLHGETVDEINAVFNTMGEKCRTILRLRFREEMPYNRIAEHLDVPLGTVCAAVSRCTDKLISLLRPVLGLPGAENGEKNGRKG